MTTLLMSAVFRTVAASTKTISQALAIAGVAVLAIVIYTGFTLQRSYMHPWFKWISCKKEEEEKQKEKNANGHS